MNACSPLTLTLSFDNAVVLSMSETDYPSNIITHWTLYVWPTTWTQMYCLIRTRMS